MNRPEVLQKLLRLGPLEPLAAREICGWSVDTFNAALSDAIGLGLVCLRRGCNQHATRLEAA